MKRSTLLITTLGIALFGCATEKLSTREPQQVGGDVGMRHINVDSLSMQNADVGMKIAFRGAEAESLYNSLPPPLSPDNPEEFVGFVARGKINSVLIRCARKKYDGDRNEYLPIGGGPLCTVSIEKTDSRTNILQNKWIFPAQ